MKYKYFQASKTFHYFHEIIPYVRAKLYFVLKFNFF